MCGWVRPAATGIYGDHDFSLPRSAAFAASIASWVPATARTSPTRSRSFAVGTSTPPSTRVIARTVAPVRPRRFTGERAADNGAPGVERHGGQGSQAGQQLVDLFQCVGRG